MSYLLAILLGPVINIILGIIIGTSRYIFLKKRGKKTELKMHKYKSFTDIDNEDIPYNGPDFINRFGTDPWDLRG